MQYLKTKSQEAVSNIVERLNHELKAKQKVTWLVSGGSNIEFEVEVMKALLTQANDNLIKLTILPLDERYGPPGHKDSNVSQLLAAGYQAGPAKLVDVLSSNLSLARTVELYNKLVTQESTESEFILGQFGLGEDGHIAGLLPHSPAIAEKQYVAGYKGPDYTRMTLTPKALLSVNVGYVLAFGASKETALRRLQSNNESIEDLPAQILYQLPELYVYNDVIGSEG